MNHKLVEGHFCNMMSSSIVGRFTCMPTSIYMHATIFQVIYPSYVIICYCRMFSDVHFKKVEQRRHVDVEVVDVTTYSKWVTID